MLMTEIKLNLENTEKEQLNNKVKIQKQSFRYFIVCPIKLKQANVRKTPKTCN